MDPRAMSPEQLRQYQEQMGNMDASAFAAQAAALRQMDKMTLRRMNPQFANMNDQQIDFAISQIEMMSKNPQMMEMAKNQLKGMTPEQLQDQAKAAMNTMGESGRPGLDLGTRVKLKGLAKAPEHNGKFGSVVGYQNDRCKVALDGETRTLALRVTNLDLVQAPASTDQDRPAPAVQMPNMKDMAENLDPQALRAQAQALRSMDPDTVRRTNPQMAHMSNQQILAAAQQMETMAEMMKDPSMAQMVKNQVSNLTPEQLQSFQRMAASGNMPAPPPMVPPPTSNQLPPQPAKNGVPATGIPDAATAASMMENMDPSQLESMIGMIKENPDMFKSMLKSNPMFANVDDATIEAQLKMMDNLSADQLKTVVGYVSKAQKAFAPALKAYAKVDQATGGRLKHILLMALAAIATALISKFFKWLTGYSLVSPLLSAFFRKKQNEIVSQPETDNYLADAVQQSTSALDTAHDSEHDEFLDLDQ